MTSNTIISFDAFRQKKLGQIKKQGVSKSASVFSRDTQSDELTNATMGVTYKALIDAGIDVQAEENQEALIAIYDLMRTITDRHFDVPNNLNITRDVQSEYGTPFFLIGVAVDDEND